MRTITFSLARQWRYLSDLFRIMTSLESSIWNSRTNTTDCPFAQSALWIRIGATTLTRQAEPQPLILQHRNDSVWWHQASCRCSRYIKKECKMLSLVRNASVLFALGQFRFACGFVIILSGKLKIFTSISQLVIKAVPDSSASVLAILVWFSCLPKLLPCDRHPPGLIDRLSKPEKNSRSVKP